MKMILLFPFLINLTLITTRTLDSITSISITDKSSTLIHDIFYSNDEYTLLLDNKIMKGTYGSDNFQEFTVNGIGQYSSVIKFDNYYAIACSENFFVGLYSSNLNLLNSIK